MKVILGGVGTDKENGNVVCAYATWAVAKADLLDFYEQHKDRASPLVWEWVNSYEGVTLRGAFTVRGVGEYYLWLAEVEVRGAAQLAQDHADNDQRVREAFRRAFPERDVPIE